MRLHKYLAQCGVASRRKAEELILEGRVSVNGEVVNKLGIEIDPDTDSIKLSNKVVKPLECGLIMMNKPLGVITTKSDPDGRATVMDLIGKKYSAYFPIGRLDFNTTGLLLLTNDGDLAERLTHPRFGFSRSYRVKVRGNMTKRSVQEINKGLKLADGFVKAKCRITRTEGDLTSMEIILKEGRNRLVRRLVEHFGCKVVALKRIAFGPFVLGTLKPGEFRLLKKSDYENFKAEVFQESK